MIYYNIQAKHGLNYVCKIFRKDGTGIDYYLYDDESINFVEPFWWRIDEKKDIIVCFLGLPDTTEWTGGDRVEMQKFQDGDYSGFFAPHNFGHYREDSLNEAAAGDLYHLQNGDNSDICVVYAKESDSTELDY